MPAWTRRLDPHHRRSRPPTARCRQDRHIGVTASSHRKVTGPTGTAGMNQLHQATPLVERLHALVEHLAAHPTRVTSGRALAHRLGVSTRTVERDVARLISAGIPIQTLHGPHGGYRLAAARRLSPITFSLAETAALIATISAIGPYTSAAANTALTKLLTTLQPPARQA
jgi:biotin operon repressor